MPTHEPGATPPEPTAPADQSLSLRPPRRVFVLSYLGVVVSGLLGAAIGAGLVDAMCRGDCTVNVAAGAVTGAVVAAVGVAVVAVLMLRAMHEWNQYQARIDIDSIPTDPPPEPPEPPEPSEPSEPSAAEPGPTPSSA